LGVSKRRDRQPRIPTTIEPEPAGDRVMLPQHGQSEELPYINMTPMVDVVLCLLVFFMVATRLYDWDESQFNVKVPQVATAAPLTSAPEDLVLTIAGPDKIEMLGQVYNLAALTTSLTQARERYADQAVQIRGDGKLDYQDLADVLSACEEAGISSVRLRVQPRPQEPPGG
jgi:biopolymer transport protein ExbD